MSIFDSVAQLAKGLSGEQNHTAVASGLLDELGGTGGIAGLIQSFHQNGAGGLIEQWAGGQTQTADASAIEQGLGGSALIDNIAQRTGLSGDKVRMGLAAILPVLVNHVTANGHVTPDGQPTATPAPESGTLIQSILGKLL